MRAGAHMDYLGSIPVTLQGSHCGFQGTLRPLPGLEELHGVAVDGVEILFSHDDLKLVHDIFASNVLRQPAHISSGCRILPAHKKTPRGRLTASLLTK